MLPRVSRRALLRTGRTVATLGVLGSLAGCGNPLGGSGGDGRDRIDIVPQGADAVVGVDAAGLLSDSNLRERVNGLLSEGGGPDSVEAVLDRVQSQAGLDPRGLQEVLLFTPFDGRNPRGVVFWTEWSQSDLFGAMREAGLPSTETTYAGKTIVESESAVPPLAVGTLEEGTFVAGPSGTVRSVVDRWQGDGQAVDGDPRTAFTAASEGYLRFGFDVPAERIPDRSGQAMNPGVLRGVEYGYGSLSTDRVLAVSLEAESESAATDVEEFLVAAKSMALGRLQDTAASTPRQEQFRRILDGTSVTRDQQTVTVRNESGGGAVILAVAAVVGSFVLGVGSQQTQSPPQIAFQAEYDPEARELTITHTGGDLAAAEGLFVRGENVPTGRWDRLGGSTSGDQDGRPAVTAGDRLTLSEVPPDYLVRIVWRPGDGNRSAVLFEDQGPEA